MIAERYDVLIVGAGISGLASAVLLHEAGLSVRVLEAQSSVGGRVRSLRDESTGAALADLGPSWVWPPYQPVVADWLSKLGLKTTPQFNDGDAILDMSRSASPTRRFFPGQHGCECIVGRSSALIDALMSRLPEGTVTTSSPVTQVDVSHASIVEVHSTERHQAAHLIVALPPRLAESTITWSPELVPLLARVLQKTPTWMAPHAKVVAIYERPFWRESGLSGRVASRVGPIGEAHDHSDDGTAALWGFIALDHTRRSALGSKLEMAVREQLRRCFGSGAPEPTQVHIEDWSRERWSTSASDLEGPMHHPDVMPGVVREAHYERRVFFAGAETAERSPGLIEGALDSANRVARQVLASVGGAETSVSSA